MKLLLDTHVLIWWLADPWRVPDHVQDTIVQSASDVFVSAASAWEIGVKLRIGKLAFDAVFLDDFDTQVRSLAFGPLPMTAAHAVAGAKLPGSHKDPFDRMLIAQSLVEDIPLVSSDAAFDAYPINRLW